MPVPSQQLPDDQRLLRAVVDTDVQLFPLRVAVEVRSNDLWAMETGETVENEEPVEFEGRPRIYFSSKTPLRDAEGEVYGVCGVAFDVTDQHEAEGALRRQADELAEAGIRKDEPLATRLELRLGDSALRVRGDATRLSQVIASLLHNASKHSPRGGRMSLEVEEADSGATIEVRDQGAQPLERTEGGLGIGLGIGLTLARELMELHEGEITAESAGEGRGSLLRVRLPLLPPEGNGSDRPSGRRDGRPEAGSGRRVLIVDDNRDSADSLGTLLELGGHVVEVAYDGESGLEAAGRFDPDVVLLDIGLPQLDGYEVARRLRESRDDLLIVAITGYGQASARERAAEAGFDHHLLKPVDLAELRRLLGWSGEAEPARPAGQPMA